MGGLFQRTLPGSGFIKIFKMVSQMVGSHSRQENPREPIFRDHQITIRTGNLMRHVVLTRRQQQYAAAAVGALFLTLVILAISLLSSLDALSERDRHVRTLQGVVADAELRHRDALGAVLTTLAETRNRYESEADNVELLVGSLTSRVDRYLNLWQQKQLLAAQNAELSRQVDGLQGELADLRAYQAEMFAWLRSTIEEQAKRLTRNLEATGLDIDALLLQAAQADADMDGAGGPYLPVNSSEPRTEVPADVPGRTNAFQTVDAARRVLLLTSLAEHLPIGYPVQKRHRMSSGFGLRTDPFNGGRARHEGVDFAAPTGTPIHATGAGVVVFAGRRGGYGKVVEIAHKGKAETVYAHLHKILVKPGQEIKAGQKIGLMGNSGRSTGSHLHYETRINGRARNPMTFITVGRNVYQDIRQSEN
ncbi:M23 family metallopeptidase [Thiohalocapsa marina]|nr:M23 family metallopeptidase [Thiohalocapsa marina]